MVKRRSRLEIEINELSLLLEKQGCTIIDGIEDPENPKLTIKEYKTEKTFTIDKVSLLKNTEQLDNYYGMNGIDEVAQMIVDTFKLN